MFTLVADELNILDYEVLGLQYEGADIAYILGVSVMRKLAGTCLRFILCYHLKLDSSIILYLCINHNMCHGF